MKVKGVEIEYFTLCMELLSHGGTWGKNCGGGVDGVGWACKPILVLSFGPRFGLKTAGPS